MCHCEGVGVALGDGGNGPPMGAPVKGPNGSR